MVVIVCLMAHAERPEPLGPTNSVIKLFNGKDLFGFHTWLVDTKGEDPRHVFTVTNGMIRVSGEGLGYLSTDREYQNYHLIAEFKWGERNWSWGDRIGKARDSGIFLHSIGPEGNSQDGNGAFKAAIECQIMQGAVGDLLLIRGSHDDGSLISPRFTVPVYVRADENVEGVTRETHVMRDADGWPYWREDGKHEKLERWGRVNWRDKAREWKDVLDFRGPTDAASPSSLWTRVECICANDDLTIRVNGKLVNGASGIFPSSGKILLQCEGSEIFFRRLELRPLKEARR